jgi:hypothetical protein
MYAITQLFPLILGYNDLGENLPRQGGTNSKVQFDMAATLKKEGKLQYLKAYWYVGKDRDQPVDASKKERNCHGKSAIPSLSLVVN